MAKIANFISELIGHTPLLRLNRITEGCKGEVVAKLESFNPCGSIKDRIGYSMIEAAEKAGWIQKRYDYFGTYQWQYRDCFGIYLCGERLSIGSDDARYDVC